MPDNYKVGKLKFAAAALIAALPSGGLLFLLRTILEWRGTWTWYTAGIVFYTILIFVDISLEDGFDLFGPRPGRPWGTIALVHLGFLFVQLLLVQVSLRIHTLLPPWFTARNRRGGSWFDLALVAALMIIFFVEEDWLTAKKPGGDDYESRAVGFDG